MADEQLFDPYTGKRLYPHQPRRYGDIDPLPTDPSKNVSSGYVILYIFKNLPGLIAALASAGALYMGYHNANSIANNHELQNYHTQQLDSIGEQLKARPTAARGYVDDSAGSPVPTQQPKPQYDKAKIQARMSEIVRLRAATDDRAELAKLRDEYIQLGQLLEK